MIENKTSLLVQNQLPEFVRDNPDYENFTLFVKAYYEWMELSNTSNSLSTTANSYNQGAIHSTKNLLKYNDIDSTIDDFTEYYIKDFLPSFPKDVLIDKQEAVKIAKQLYQIKGTPASYEFLFRILYNSDFDIFYTKDAIFKASDGQWYITKSLKLSSTDKNFLNIENLRLFGETSKSIATVETSLFSGNKVEVFISNMERTFQSGEFVRVVDSDNQDVYFKNGKVVSSTTAGAEKLRAKIVGQISSVALDKKYRGNYYNPGDPVVIYGGLSSETGIGATAVVGDTQTGSVQRVGVISGGFGYTTGNTLITFTAPTGKGATAHVGTVDPSGSANVGLIPIDTISFKKDVTIGSTNYHFSNIATSNANTKLVNAFTFTGFETFPIAAVLVDTPGGGYRTKPDTQAVSSYQSDLILYEGGPTPNVAHVPLLSSLGILGPIQITNGGQGYQNNDTIIFTGGMGQGAKANVTVNANGSIIKVRYVQDTLKRYPLGGMGYRNTDLPTLTVNSSNVSASNASLYVPGILGTGAVLNAVTDNAGEIVTIKMIDYGEDYIETPKVSLKVQDVLVSNVSIDNLPKTGETIIQGTNIGDATYIASVNNVTELVYNANTQLSIWNLRVFNYNSKPDPTKPLVIEGRNINFNLANTALTTDYDSNGIRSYGDGTAKGNAKFLNGLVIGEGQYLDSRGQPSSFSVIQSEIYNNYTYQITVEKEISKYRDVLFKLLHPTGMKVIGRYAMKSSIQSDYNLQDALFTGHNLRFYTDDAVYVTANADFVNKSTNIIKFNDMPMNNPPVVLSDFLVPNYTRLAISTTNGPYIDAKVISINDAANTAVLDSNVWLTYANVAYVSANAGSNSINITSLTGQYDIMNNGVYSNTAYPLKDIVFAGDKVLIGNNTSKTVKNVDYENGIIYLTTNLANNSNSLLSVNRTFVANTRLNSEQIKIFGPIGQQYINPQLLTEDGMYITDETGNILLIG